VFLTVSEWCVLYPTIRTLPCYPIIVAQDYVPSQSNYVPTFLPSVSGPVFCRKRVEPILGADFLFLGSL